MNQSGEPPITTPPPPGVEAGATGNPWEQRDRLGVGVALLEAVKQFIVSPAEAFGSTRRKGDYGSPLIFAILLGWAGAIIGQIWNFALQSSLMQIFPGGRPEDVGMMFAGTLAGLLIGIVVAPFVIVIFLFLGSAIYHLFLMLVGGLADSEAGFEGTFRVLCYASVAQLAQVVPLVGSLISLVWSIVLLVIGLSILHRTTQGKAVAAVLLPLVLCCVCAVIGGIMFGAGIAALMSGQGG